MGEVIITSILQGFDKKNHFFEGWSWLKLNNLGLIKLLHKCGKTVVTKSQKCLGANSCVCRSYRRKTGREAFLPPPILNRVDKANSSLPLELF